MKKLSKRNTCTPTDASQVSGNCDPVLNRVDTLSVLDSKTLDNRSEVNLLQSEYARRDLRVPVNVIQLYKKQKYDYQSVIWPDIVISARGTIHPTAISRGFSLPLDLTDYKWSRYRSFHPQQGFDCACEWFN